MRNSFSFDFFEDSVGNSALVFQFIGSDRCDPKFLADVLDTVLHVFQLRLVLCRRSAS